MRRTSIDTLNDKPPLRKLSDTTNATFAANDLSTMRRTSIDTLNPVRRGSTASEASTKSEATSSMSSGKSIVASISSSAITSIVGSPVSSRLMASRAIPVSPVAPAAAKPARALFGPRGPSSPPTSPLRAEPSMTAYLQNEIINSSNLAKLESTLKKQDGKTKKEGGLNYIICI